MLDLQRNQYSIETLKKHIYSHRIIEFLETQRLTADFIINYVLNPKYQLSDADAKITISDILRCQPHITKMELVLAITLNSNDAENNDDVDVDIDFERVACGQSCFQAKRP